MTLKFNPFEYILILEECLINPQLYKEKEELFKNFMECVEKNKDNEHFIEMIEKEINKKMGGATSDANLTMQEVQKNIDGINKNIKTEVEKAINDVKSINNDNLTLFILNSVKDGKTEKTEKNIKDLLLLTNYGLKTLLECQTILQEINKDNPDEKLQTVHDELNAIIKTINNIIGLAKDYESIPPDKNFNNSLLSKSNFYHKKTNEVLLKILKTEHTNLNSAAAKVIIASSIIFATMKCLSISTAKNDLETNKIIKKILQDDMNIINGNPVPIPTSGNNSDIVDLIKKTILILNKKCKPEHMMDTFIYVLSMIEKNNS